MPLEERSSKKTTLSLKPSPLKGASGLSKLGPQQVEVDLPMVGCGNSGVF